MRPGPIAYVAATLAFAVADARADCPTAQAACLLHEEGVALLADKKYDEAAAKFEASITAGTSARAQLGFALALQGAGRLGLAFDAIVEADRLSAWELRGAPGDAEVRARSERIKYVLADLRSRVGLVRVQLPAEMAPQLLVTVEREGHDVRDPRAVIAVGPGDKLVAVLSTGARYEGDAPVAAGGEAVWIVPATGGTAGGASGLPAPVVTKPAARMRIGIDLAYLPADSAFGPLIHAAWVPSSRVALTLRAGYLPHGGSTVDNADSITSTSGSEIAGWLGANIALGGAVYAALDLGVLAESATAETRTFAGVLQSTTSNTATYLVYGAGVGVRGKHIDARIGLEGAFAGLGQTLAGDEPDLSVRLMISFGVDLYPW